MIFIHYPQLAVIGFLLLLGAAVLVSKWRRKRHAAARSLVLRRQQEQEFLEFCEKAERGDLSDVSVRDVFTTPWWHWPGLKLVGELEGRRKSALAAYDYYTELHKFEGFLRAWLDASDEESERQALLRLLQAWKEAPSQAQLDFAESSGFRKAPALDRLTELIQQRYRDLSELLASGDGNEAQLEALSALIRSTMIYGDCRSVGVPELPYPSEWSAWVAQYIENPSKSWFVTPEGKSLPEYRELPAGTIALKAAYALRQEDLVAAKVALAYCHAGGSGSNVKHEAREEVGSALMAELLKYVAGRNVRLGLSPYQVARQE